MSTKHVHLELDEDLLSRIDEARGDVPRNRWIRRILESVLDGKAVATVETVGRASERARKDRKP